MIGVAYERALGRLAVVPLVVAMGCGQCDEPVAPAPVTESTAAQARPARPVEAADMPPADRPAPPAHVPGFPEDLPISGRARLDPTYSAPGATYPTFLLMYDEATPDEVEAMVVGALDSTDWTLVGRTPADEIEPTLLLDIERGSTQAKLAIGVHEDATYLYLTLYRGAGLPATARPSEAMRRVEGLPGWPAGFPVPGGGLYDPVLTRPYAPFPNFLFRYPTIDAATLDAALQSELEMAGWSVDYTQPAGTDRPGTAYVVSRDDLQVGATVVDAGGTGDLIVSRLQPSPN